MADGAFGGGQEWAGVGRKMSRANQWPLNSSNAGRSISGWCVCVESVLAAERLTLLLG